MTQILGSWIPNPSMWKHRLSSWSFLGSLFWLNLETPTVGIRVVNQWMGKKWICSHPFSLLSLSPSQIIKTSKFKHTVLCFLNLCCLYCTSLLLPHFWASSAEHTLKAYSFALLNLMFHSGSLLCLSHVQCITQFITYSSCIASIHSSYMRHLKSQTPFGLPC